MQFFSLVGFYVPCTASLRVTRVMCWFGRAFWDAVGLSVAASHNMMNVAPLHS